MQGRHVQMTMAAAGFYNGGIDGILGPISWAAIVAVEKKHKAVYKFNAGGSTDARRRVASAQACLAQLDYDPGDVDGWQGVFTNEALNAFLFEKTNGKAEVVKRDPLPDAVAPSGIPTQSQVGSVYGSPGPQIKSRLKTVDLPFKLRLDWNLRKSVGRVTLHKDCAPQFVKAMGEIRDHYGEDKMKALGLDRYAGGYNHRKMRGSNRWSMHAYGCAVDFYAQPNGLRTRCPHALFCKDEYKPFLDIMEANEWLPAIRLWGADAMHFQRARL